MRHTVQKPLYTNVSLLYVMSRAELAGYATQSMTPAQYDAARKKLASMPAMQMVSPDAACALVLGGNPFAGWFAADDREDAVVMRRRDLYKEIIMTESKWLRERADSVYLETFDDVTNGYVQGYMPALDPLRAVALIDQITRDILFNE